MDSAFFISRRFFTLGLAAAGGSALLGCSSTDTTPAAGAVSRQVAVLPPLASAKLTTERTIVLSHAVAAKTEQRSPMNPEERGAMVAEGYGDYTWGAGEPTVSRMPDGSAPPVSGPARKQLARFVQMTDLHVTDDESPLRLELFDGPDPLDGAARPQAPYEGRILNAAVRTINAVHAALPIDFVLVTGDVTDSAQQNEATWFLKIMTGGVYSVACDSGDANDPVPGTNNDPKDPFMPEGLKMPWLFCMGNHDALIMGINPITPQGQATATGAWSNSGFTDWTQAGGVVRKGDAVPDESRKPLVREEFLALVATDGDGHGVKETQVPKRTCFVQDIPDTQLRLIVHDTAAEGGGASGVVRNSVVEAFLRPALNAAKAEGKLVILASHHPMSSIDDGSGANAETEADAMLPAALRAFLLGYDNVILSVTGHTHQHVVTWFDGGAGKGSGSSRRRRSSSFRITCGLSRLRMRTMGT